MKQPPPVLPYSDGQQPQGPSSGRQVMWGVLAGTAISAIVWILGWPAFLGNGGAFLWAIVTVPGAKMLAAILLLVPRNYRFVGIGLLISIPIGVAIFFGSCFMHK